MSRRRADDERGLMIVIYAIAMTVLLTIAALVIDLGQLRTDRRVNKSVADTAARAGVGVLSDGPWAGVCRASAYVRANAREGSFDAGSEQWFRMNAPTSALAANPCSNTGVAPYTTPCQSDQPGTWGRLTATLSGGLVSVEIQSGYAMPDGRFAEDLKAPDDSGSACDNLSVIVKEQRTGVFSGIVGGQQSTTIRSVARQDQSATLSEVPALLLLEQRRCAVLTVTSANGRVVAQPSGNQAGVMQIDSAADTGVCTSNQAALNGKETSGKPSILACSASATPIDGACTASSVEKPSRIGVYGLKVPHPPNVYVTSGPGTYGDTTAVGADPVGRGVVDEVYRENVEKLDGTAKVLLNGDPKPPGCSTVVGNACTDTNGATWLVLNSTECGAYGTFFTAARAASPRIWFGCDLTVSTSALTLTGAGATVVVSGALSVRAPFSIIDPSRVYIGGRTGGDKTGLGIGNGGNLSIGKPNSDTSCPVSGRAKYTAMVVGNGAFDIGSSGTIHLCGTSVFMASGFGKVPTVDGTDNCSSPCNTYLGTLKVSSGAVLDWSAPNLIKDRRPTDEDLVTSPLEDLAFWTEAGTDTNGVSGGASTKMGGVFFLGNADRFTLAGGGGIVNLSAQFVARRMEVTGGAVVNLVPNPFDSVPIISYELALVR
jgi:hypothetical protein